MTGTKTIGSLMIAIITSSVSTIQAKDPKEPLPHGANPNDWKCVYPYSETNCARVIRFWSEDYLDDPENVSEDIVGCDDCEAITATDWNGDQWTVQYRCNKPLGYQIVADDLEVKLPKYRKGDSQNGWTVLDWAMYECVRTWRCYDLCAWERGEPACLVTAVISIGKFQPVLGKPCEQQSAEVDRDPLADSPAGSDSSGP